MMTDPEKKFHQAMLLIYERARDECGYNATRFLQMVNSRGGLEAARLLLHSPLSDGFTALWELGRLDITMEALILQPTWSSLFTNEELEIARQRLEEAGFISPGFVSGARNEQVFDWWNQVSNKVNRGDILFTPGRGLQGLGKKPFTIVSKDASGFVIQTGSSRIRLEKECFDALEQAFWTDRSLWLRVASLHGSEPLEGGVDELVREKTGSQLARGNYICSILEHCGLVRYSIRGNKKGIELPKSSTNGSQGRVDKSPKRKREGGRLHPDNLLEIWEIIRWLDDARWNEEETKKVLIPGPVFEKLGNSQKILVHWLAYITDQQRPYQEVWMRGGPIFAEIVSEYRQGHIDSIELLKDFTNQGDRTDRTDRFESKIQLIDGEKIEYTPRFGMHILSIARTLYLLKFFDCDIVQYLSQHWEFLESVKQGIDGDNLTSRIAFLLYLLSYAEITRGILSFHRHERAIMRDLRNYGSRLKRLLGDTSELTLQFEKWSKRDKYHKRLWAGLRDYLKPRSTFREYLLGALDNLREERFKCFVRDQQNEILESLELPGDIWNLRFMKRIFEEKMGSPEELRAQYQNLRVSHNIGTRFYPEQFDVSFSFSPYMCEEIMEEYCPFRAHSRIREFCLHAIGASTSQKLCPVAMITCGYTYYCQPGSCPIKDGVTNDLCPGCSIEVGIEE